jgi:FkbH-like protein
VDTADFLFPRDLEVTPTQIKRVLFVGSCLSEAYLKHVRTANAATTYEHVLFNNAADLPARPAEDLACYDLQYIQLPLRSILTDAVIRIADNDRRETPIAWLDLGKLNIDHMLDKAMAYNQQTGLLTLVSTFFVPQGHIGPSLADIRSRNDLAWVVNELNNHLAEKVREFRNAVVADVDMIANSLGKRFFLDDFIGFYTHGSVHYPDWGEGSRIEPVPRFVETYENRLGEFFDAVFRQIEAIYRTVKQIDQVKVVIFDLDNTLWRGQLVEHYQPGEQWPHAHGWPLGVWEAVHHLRWRGIMTALASKNDHEVVVARWNDAVDPPFVKFEDFIAPQINWQPKSANIAAILGALSLTPKSAVLVDDHPAEREAVKAAFPAIRTIGSNPFLTRRILLWSPEMQIASRTEESKRREQMVLSQIQRERQRVSMSHDDFLTGLETSLNIWELVDTAHHTFTRVLELANKTNQFNTTGRRWSVSDYESFFRAGGRLFAFSVTDRFTDYGTVGVVFLKTPEIVQYVMSCRVLGMEVEIAALQTLIAHVRERGPVRMFGDIIPSPVNTPCRDVFSKSGFETDDGHDGRFLLGENKQPVSPRHIRVRFQSAAVSPSTSSMELADP